MSKEILYRVFLLCLIPAVCSITYFLGSRDQKFIVFGLSVLFMAAFFKSHNPLHKLNTYYPIKVRVFDPDGSCVDDAQVTCTMGVKGEPHEDGWLFKIKHVDIPFNLKTRFLATKPNSGLLAFKNVFFSLRNKSEVEIHLKEDKAIGMAE